MPGSDGEREGRVDWRRWDFWVRILAAVGGVVAAATLVLGIVALLQANHLQDEPTT